jgi:hypothetical protein
MFGDNCRMPETFRATGDHSSLILGTFQIGLTG